MFVIKTGVIALALLQKIKFHSADSKVFKFIAAN